MNGDFFVQIVNNDGNLGRLYGPASWEDAIVKVKAYVTQQGPDEPLEQALALIDNGDGSYEWGDGDGIYIVQAEPIDAPLPSDEDDEDDELDMDDEDEELRRDEKNGLYGGRVDPAN